MNAQNSDSNPSITEKPKPSEKPTYQRKPRLVYL